MASKFALVILNLLLMSLLFSQCLAKKPARGFKGNARNKHKLVDMLMDSKSFINSFPSGVNKQPNPTPPSEPPTTENVQVKEAGVAQSNGIYTISLAIGTPPQNVTLAMDISSDVIWTPCQDRCWIDCLNQSTPLYNPNISSTSSKFYSDRCLDTTFNQSSVCKTITPESCPDSFIDGLFGCVYLSTYGDLYSLGNLITDTITLSSSVPDIVFGCGQFNLGDYGNTSGVLGLGRGPLSFLSQLQYDRFSYRLSSDQTKDSPVNFGSFAILESGSGQSTPLVRNTDKSSLYYISLLDITVGTTPLNIPSSTFQLQADGSGGVYLSTSFPVTYLEEAGYDLAKKAIISQMNQPTVSGTNLDLDLCFNNSVTKSEWPLLTLQFEGNASLKLRTTNYVVKDPKTGFECFTILPSRGFSAFGSFIQMDTNFVYDLENSTISFEQFNDVEGSGPSTSPAPDPGSLSGMSPVPRVVTTMLFFLLCMPKFF